MHLTRAAFTAMTDIYVECSSCVAGKNSTVSHGGQSSVSFRDFAKNLVDILVTLLHLAWARITQ